MYFLHSVIISVSRKTSQIWMSLHIITLGKAGSAASVRWHCPNRLPPERGCSDSCGWECTATGCRTWALIFAIGRCSFKCPENRNKSSGIRKQMQMLYSNLMRLRALCCRWDLGSSSEQGGPVCAWIHFYMVRCLLKGKLRHNSSGNKALYTFH